MFGILLQKSNKCDKALCCEICLNISLFTLNSKTDLFSLLFLCVNLWDLLYIYIFQNGLSLQSENREYTIQQYSISL